MGEAPAHPLMANKQCSETPIESNGAADYPVQILVGPGGREVLGETRPPVYNAQCYTSPIAFEWGCRFCRTNSAAPGGGEVVEEAQPLVANKLCFESPIELNGAADSVVQVLAGPGGGEVLGEAPALPLVPRMQQHTGFHHARARRRQRRPTSDAVSSSGSRCCIGALPQFGP